MIKWMLFIPFIFSLSAHALDAVITVLEAPLFKDKSLDSRVVQYLRKGDVIKIHPSISNDKNLDQYAPDPEKLLKLKQKLKQSTGHNQDQLFRGEEENTFFIEDEFIPTLDRQGNRVYVLSKHLYVYFEDSREFNHRPMGKDLTDYRLEEPLPKNYPLPKSNEVRGQFLLGLAQPYTENYPYQDEVKTKGYSSPFEINGTLLKLAPGNYNERLFIGGTLNFRSFENTLVFTDNRTSIEKSTRIGIGPTISFDGYKGDKNRINLSTTILVNLIDRLSIQQTSSTNIGDNRTYSAYSVVPKVGIQYHRKKIIADFDLVLGMGMEIGLPAVYNAKNAGSVGTWWQDLGNDQFKTKTTYTSAAFLGVQSVY